MNALKENMRTGLPIVLIVVVGLFSQMSCSQTALAPASSSPSPSASPSSAALGETPAVPDSSSAPSMTAGGTRPSDPAVASPAQMPAPPPPAPQSPSSAERPAPPPPPPPPPPRTFTLAPGRSLAVYTATTLSSKTSKNGDVFVASLANPIVDGDWVIAKKGAHVEGVVSNSDQGGRVKGVASLSLRLRSLQLADGRTVAISSSQFIKEAKSTKKKDAVKIGIGAGIGAAIGAIAGGGKGAAIGAGVGGGGGTAAVMATRGDPAVIPSESQLNFKLTSSVKVTRH